MAFVQLLISGVSLGCIYALIALGFVLIYKATETVNFAQGELMMLGAFAALVLMKSAGWSFWAAAPAAVVAMLARSGHHVGGAEGPYSVSFCTVLFCWSLIMPGGARYAAFPILGGLVTSTLLNLLVLPTLYAVFGGEEFPVTKEEFFIGRGQKTCDLVIRDTNISRQHARIVVVEEAVPHRALAGAVALLALGEREQLAAAQADLALAIDADDVEVLEGLRAFALGSEQFDGMDIGSALHGLIMAPRRRTTRHTR